MSAEPATAGGKQGGPPTPEPILELGSAFWGSKTLLSAIELGLFSELAASGPLDADGLRERLGLHPRSARDFFDALVALGMLDRQDDAYANTPATELYLDRAKPTYVGGMLEMMNARLTGSGARSPKDCEPVCRRTRPRRAATSSRFSTPIRTSSGAS